jgi:DNA-binding helix-turn-helix protein
MQYSNTSGIPTGTPVYTSDLHRKVVEAFNNFKQETGNGQQYVADKMGISQPALYKYLRGTLKLNQSFLERFTKALGIRLDTFVVDTYTRQNLPIKYLLSGKEITKEIEIMALNVVDSVFGIEVDTPTSKLRRGAVLMVDKNLSCCDLDNVVLMTDERIIFGVLEYKPDMYASSWAVREEVDEHTARYHELKRGDKVYHVIGIHFSRVGTERKMTL